METNEIGGKGAVEACCCEAPLVEVDAFDPEVLCGIVKRHDLQRKWTRFCERFEIDDPCGGEQRP